MNAPAKSATMVADIIKTDPNSPALSVTGPTTIAIKAGTVFGGRTFDQDTPVAAPEEGLTPGGDYVVLVPRGAEPKIARLVGAIIALPPETLGGFHFAPGGNAAARSGGDSTPAINPHSAWDVAFRPACTDPRGMVLVDASGHRFWADIYLTAADHLGGTSLFGVAIADGVTLPSNPAGGRFRRFDYPTAQAVMAHHGKGLLSIEEFFAAAFGVTERTAAADEPELTGLDAPRTSRWGLMQATGNMWVWGHDGDLVASRASLFGGGWVGGGSASSRRAYVGDWPGGSDGLCGARGRCDHLQPA